MKFLLILALILILAILLGIIDINPLLTQAQATATAPSEGFDTLYTLFGWK